MLTLAEHADQLSSAIQLRGNLAEESVLVLRALQDKLAELNAKLAPIHDRATALTWAEDNITKAKLATDELVRHISVTRKVEGVLRLGLGRSEEQLDVFLGAVGQLEEALDHLEANLVEAVTQPYEHAAAVYERAMSDCEADFAAVLAAHSTARLPSAAWLADKAALENLRASIADPEMELLPPAAVARVSRLAEAMLRARHVGCLDTYAQARSRALDMLLALVGLDPSALGLSSMGGGGGAGGAGGAGSGPSFGGGGGGGLALQLQSAEQLQRLVVGWSTQLRVLLVGASAELALAQDVWQSPYDEVTFSETISRSLRLVLQVGKAVCEGRGAGRSPDRLFALLQMHQSLMELLPYLDDLLSPRERCTGLLNEAHLLGVMIGRAARQLFADFEESVGGRSGGGAGLSAADAAASKLTMLDGTVHPICATTLSFLKRLFTFPNALSLLFAPSGAGGGVSSGDAAEAAAAAAAAASSSIMRILMRLLEALEAKARAYKSPALGSLFLMNNVHYMVWTVEQAAAADKQKASAAAAAKTAAASAGAAAAAEAEAEAEAASIEAEGQGSSVRARRRARRAAEAAAEAAEAEAAAAAAAHPDAAVPGGLAVLGRAWVERHKDIVEHYGAAYQDASWKPLAELLEAVVVTETDKEPSDPGRFKNWVKSKFAKINSLIDGLLKQQSSWTIPDAKLKNAVRKVIKQDVLPLYREFWDRYTEVDFTTHPEKYLRYPPEQLEHVIDHTLFEGRAAPPRAGGGGGGQAAGGGGGGGLLSFSSPGSVKSGAAGRMSKDGGGGGGGSGAAFPPGVPASTHSRVSSKVGGSVRR
ncbi:hypothetical protein HYH02_012736 [Chlamydomonas schloesseri]|uniref:Exocyst subunit Exo70 family protein n=1 Tax=Chlamydomonas schloesseri TaxID=2026947 RepID=A0A835SU14_9CHLO|nr:hypothetical protein HYH02_012736 [Chlamydomonas schloesseri]|eukprot:KAG2433194.1 hypothetical protein HYH02_012736 [Chlamydomonas schloesseri]